MRRACRSEGGEDWDRHARRSVRKRSVRADGSLRTSAHRPRPAPQTYDLLTINVPLPRTRRPTGLFKHLIHTEPYLPLWDDIGGAEKHREEFLTCLKQQIPGFPTFPDG